VPGATVLPQLSIVELAGKIEEASLVVGVDTGFVHLAHALMKRTVMIFTATSKDHCGVHAPYRSISLGSPGHVPEVRQVLDAIDYVHGDARIDEPMSIGSVAAA
jgi:heptosyltransferase-1